MVNKVNSIFCVGSADFAVTAPPRMICDDYAQLSIDLLSSAVQSARSSGSALLLVDGLFRKAYDQKSLGEAISLFKGVDVFVVPKQTDLDGGKDCSVKKNGNLDILQKLGCLQVLGFGSEAHIAGISVKALAPGKVSIGTDSGEIILDALTKGGAVPPLFRCSIWHKDLQCGALKIGNNGVEEVLIDSPSPAFDESGFVAVESGNHTTGLFAKMIRDESIVSKARKASGVSDLEALFEEATASLGSSASAVSVARGLIQ